MTGNAYVPYLPAIDPWVLPAAPFEQLIQAYGIRTSWLRNHTCPCTFGGPIPGSPDNQCKTCHGRGVYWDAPIGPFQSLITFIHRGPTPDEPGAQIDTDQGLVTNAEPTLTIPASGAFASQFQIWQEASIYDIFVEIDAVSRFNANLQVGGLQAVPYQQNLTIAASGAVTVYDPVNHVVDIVSGYTVSGSVVTLPSGYTTGTNYTVDFSAAPAYVAYRVAGMPAHVRPFASTNLPRRFRIQTLDLWTRARFSGDIPIAGV